MVAAGAAAGLAIHALLRDGVGAAMGMLAFVLVVVPCIALVVLGRPLFGAVASLLWPKRKPPQVGYCARCGYDLRATPDRCPECGAVPAA